MKTDIHPTHKCFDDALDLIGVLLKKRIIGAGDQDVHLVHALCEAPSGERYAHGWVERNAGQTVIFSGVLDGEFCYFSTDASGYYELFRVRETTKYSVAEAIAMNLAHGNYGPWEKPYIEACGEGRRVFGVATTKPDEPTDQTGNLTNE